MARQLPNSLLARHHLISIPLLLPPGNTLLDVHHLRKDIAIFRQRRLACSTSAVVFRLFVVAACPLQAVRNSRLSSTVACHCEIGNVANVPEVVNIIRLEVSIIITQCGNPRCQQVLQRTQSSLNGVSAWSTSSCLLLLLASMLSQLGHGDPQPGWPRPATSQKSLMP